MSSERGGARREDVAGEAWQAIYRLVTEGDGQRRFQAACDVSGMAPGAVKALLQLRPDAPRSMRELAETFRCDPSWVTSLVDTLEEGGLAERQLHPTDRRVKVVALTERGLHTQSDIRKILGEPPEFLEVLSTDELRQLRELLVKLVDASAVE